MPSTTNRPAITPTTLFVKPFWQAATWWGLRRLTGLLPSAYSDTITHFPTQQRAIALTIDDGLSRSGKATSMATEVCECLKNYNARATFFVCTDYLQDQRDQVLQLLEEGHELGNHMESDQAFHYHRLPAEEFRNILQKTNAILEELDPSTNRWFRAPQGILTGDMQAAIADQQGHMRHALGDCYCDDWRFAQDVDGDESTPEQRRYHMKQVADLMLSQIQPGSIAILHMPERGFREGTLDALEYLLQGLKERGYRCVNLTEMDEMVAREEPPLASNEQ